MLNIYQLEQRIQKDMQAHRIVGLALAIVQGTEVTYARGFGVTSVEDGALPITPHTLFCIGSISKTLTATLIMRLVEQGKLDLDVPVTRYLPEFAFSDPQLGKEVTLRRVLSHTTGLPPAGKDFGPRDPDALRRFVSDEIARYSFVAEPGKVHLYSNTAIVLAGYLAETVTGKYYDELVQELIFEPLQMHRSTFDRTVAMTYPLALAHEIGGDGMVHAKHRFTDNVAGNPAGFGICSTLDLANFVIMHLNQGNFHGTQILSPASIETMHTKQIDRYLPADAGYGLALYTSTHKGLRVLQHGGMLESYKCVICFVPDAGVGVVIQCNYEQAWPMPTLLYDILDHFLDLPAEQPPLAFVAPNKTQWSQHAGTYLSVQYGLAQIKVEQDQLLLERNGEVTPLIAIEGGLYQANGTSVGFVPATSGPTEYIVIDGEPYRRLEGDTSFVPDPATWTTYAGVYGEWATDPYPIRIRVADGHLYVKWWGDEVVCTPLSNTSFVSTRGLIDFEVAEDGNAPVLITHKASRNYRVSNTM